MFARSGGREVIVMLVMSYSFRSIAEHRSAHHLIREEHTAVRLADGDQRVKHLASSVLTGALDERAIVYEAMCWQCGSKKMLIDLLIKKVAKRRIDEKGAPLF